MDLMDFRSRQNWRSTVEFSLVLHRMNNVFDGGLCGWMYSALFVMRVLVRIHKPCLRLVQGTCSNSVIFTFDFHICCALFQLKHVCQSEVIYAVMSFMNWGWGFVACVWWILYCCLMCLMPSQIWSELSNVLIKVFLLSLFLVVVTQTPYPWPNRDK